jgi:hypothetical protein
MTDTFVPKHVWPIKVRSNLTQRTPYGYKTDPNDPTVFLPDYNLIQYMEEAMDQVDNGESYRSVADWLSTKLPKTISHEGVRSMWRRFRGKETDNPRVKQIRKRRRATMPKTKEGKEARRLTYQIMGAKKTLDAKQRRYEELQAKLRGTVDDVDGHSGGSSPDHVAPEIPDNVEVVFRPNPGPQEAFLAAPEQEVLYGGAAGGGKGVTLDTKVLTPVGWIEMQNLSVNDFVIDPDTGKQTKIVEKYDRGLQPTYKLTFADGASVVCDSEHLWKTWISGQGRKIDGVRVFGPASARVRSTKDIIDYYSGPHRTYRIPICNSITYSLDSILPLPPYTLGVLIGDGSLHKSITFFSTDKEIVDRVEKELGISLSCYSTMNKVGGAYALPSKPYKNIIKNLGLDNSYSYNKFIPSNYLYASLEDRVALLQGLMDTDGWIEQDGECYYTTISKQLKDDVKHLARSLGAFVTERQKFPKYQGGIGKLAYTLRIKVPDSSILFYLPRKKGIRRTTPPQSMGNGLVSIEDAGLNKTQCIVLDSDSQLFIVNDFIVTHNSYAMLADPMRYFDNKNFSGVLFRKTNDELRELISKSQGLYPKAFPGAKWQEQKSRWVFPSGAEMWLTYLDRDEDVERYQGQAFTWIGFDELGHWATPYAWNYMRSRLRSTDPTIPLSQRASANPGGLGGHWIKKMFIDPAVPGVAFDAKDLETGTVMVYPPNHAKAGQALFKRRFIPAKLSDNPYLTQDGVYEASLLSLPKHLREQLLYGNWDIMDGAAFPEFTQHDHVIEPFPIPSSWKKFRSADYGYTSFSAVHWFAIDPVYETLIVYRELYVTKHTGVDLALKILELEKNETIQYGVLDRSVWSERGQRGPSIAEEMIQTGCRWRPSDSSKGSRTAGKNRLHQLLKLRDCGTNENNEIIWKPGIQFFNACRQIISDLPTLPIHPAGVDDIDDRHSSDHTYDSIRYGIMTRPKAFSVFDFGGSQFGSGYKPADKRFGY